MTVDTGGLKSDEMGEEAAFSHADELSILDQIEIIGEREGGLIDCYVPVELIDNEEVAVHEDWAESLARNMKHRAEKLGGTGQKQAVSVGLIEGESKLKIIDGFHRTKALQLLGETRIFATIEKTDWDGLYDARIFAAKDNPHVRFSRVVQWMRESWAMTEMSQFLTVEQAALCNFDLKAPARV